MSHDPIDGQALLAAGAKASVPLSRLPDLLERVQSDLGDRREEYRREFECVHEAPDSEVFLVPSGHWESVGERLGFGRRERDAVRRAHVEQARRVGSATDRREEFESAFEIRDVVVIGADGGGSANGDADAGDDPDG